MKPAFVEEDNFYGGWLFCWLGSNVFYGGSFCSGVFYVGSAIDDFMSRVRRKNFGVLVRKTKRMAEREKVLPGKFGEGNGY